MRYSNLIKEYRRLRSICEDELFSNQTFEKAVTMYETNQI